MPKQRKLPKARNKHLNDLLISKSKRGGPHKDGRKKVKERELRETLKDYK